MSRTLFRKEVLEAKRDNWLGSVVLAQPIRAHVLTLLSVGSASAVLAFLFLCTYTHRTTVSGRLIPTSGFSVVVAPLTGNIDAVFGEEGDAVSAGDKLTAISTPRFTERLGSTQLQMQLQLSQRRAGLEAADQAQRDQLKAQAEGTAQQLASARAELAQIEKEIATREAQAKIAFSTLERLVSVEGSQFVSRIQVDQQRTTALEYQGQAQSLGRQASVIRRTIEQLSQSAQELPARLDAASANFRKDLAQLEQERIQSEAQDALIVRSPVSGTIATQLVKAGQSVQSGDPLFTVVQQDSKLEADLLAPSRAIGFIKVGDQVYLRYQAFPYQKFGHQHGVVSQISRSPVGTQETSESPGAKGGEPLYRVTVRLSRQTVVAYGNEEQLKPGMLTDADVMGEKRRLIEWVLEPLYSLRGKSNG
ncbi:HlyD family efflux transporter periplasmic adaptor subunit [Stenotrophomonas sp. 57]|uniref:HlyD family secretion protein n=1 Tax=Stenotrophomonas sp. 57 TaxID=3051119 RepID=UPI00256ECB51|nr:HlyD family efflux transporter periplasmic adaptor subunit [Stenotrophomonas sp. 57]